MNQVAPASFRRRTSLAILVLAAWAGPSTALVAQEGSLAALAEAEKETIALIARTRPAFVFIEGGSGFCISEDGWVLTNEHVVEGKNEVDVYFTGGRRYRADIVGHDRQGDVALLKLRDASACPFLELGDSEALQVGEPVLALGDPFLIGSENLFLQRVPPDYDPSASTGIVSALHRYSDTYSDAIQVDTAVNRGNSGGPLISYDGKAVGINGKIETRFALGINTGVGYAVPANQIKRFLGPLKEAGGGAVYHGTLVGLRVAERADDRRGLPVEGVQENSPAFDYGFEQGDLILSIGGRRTRTRTRYLGVLATYPVGHEVMVRVARGERELDLRTEIVVLGRPFLGVRSAARGDGGVEVTQVVLGSAAARGGLRVGDIILKLDDQPVTEPRALSRFILARKAGQRIVLGVRRGEETLDLPVHLGVKPLE